MNPIRIVFAKELTDGSRDRRAVMSAMLFPILGPALVYFMMTSLIHLQTEAKKAVIPVIGAEHAPGLIQYLHEKGMDTKTFTGDPKAAVKDKSEEVVLVIPDNFPERMDAARPAVIELVQDGSRTDARPTIGRLQRFIRGYATEIASMRLLLRGVSPTVIRTVNVEDIDVASKQQRAAAALNFIPMYIILAAFVSGMGLAIDGTAGERERRSLEPLLINPVERFEIVTGKWLAASTFAAIGMTLTALLCIAAMRLVPLSEIGIDFHVDATQVIAIILATAPVAFLATSMQLALGSFARSFKDAQSYLGILVLLPVVPSMFLLLHPVATRIWMYAVPMLGQHLLLVDLLGGKPIPIAAYFLSALSCLVVGFALVLVTARLFQRERIIST
ncbi:MAG: ABC transporter permease [Pseudomonadales bacterium]|nr:ABC transporter permease [Pseudomonadales bacterium]